MTRRITCYVVFVTLIWGAHTETKQTRPDMFKSNMTRTDFSNLLSSLIKLNEQRVSVLQKLNRLEEYGVLSEVLRSSDKKTKNGDPSNLYLIVMSKNTTDSSHRNSGYHLVDSVTSLEVAGSNNIPKLDYVLDPASFVFQNSSQENKSPQPIFANMPRFYKQKKKYIIGDRIFKFTTTKKPLQYRSVNQKRKHFINFLKATESRKIEIVNKSSNATQRRKKYSTTVVSINDQSPKYNKIELTKPNLNKLATKPIAIKDILRRKRKKPKNYLEDNVENNEDLSSFQFNISLKNYDKVKDITQIDDDLFTKQFFGNTLKPETDKDILKVQKNEKNISVDSDFADDSDYSSDSKVTDVSDQKIDVNNLPKTETDKVISKLTNISSKKIKNNHRKPVKDKVISKVTDIFVKMIDENNHSKPVKGKVVSNVTNISVKRIHNNHRKPLTDKVISKVTDIAVKRIHNHHRKPRTEKVISNVTDISVKRIHNNHRKPQTDKVISKVTDISVKRIHNNHRKPLTDKVFSKVTDIFVKRIHNYHRKPGPDKVISKVNDVSLKNIDYNNHPKSETNQHTLKAKVQLIQNKSNLLNLDDKTSRIETERRTTVLKNPDPIINGTVRSVNASDHTVFYTSPIPNPNLYINRDNAYANNFMAYLRRKNATMKTDHENGVPLITTRSQDIILPVATSNILAPLKFPTTPKNTPNRDNLDFWNPNNSKDKDLHNGDNHSDANTKKIKDYDHEENNNNGKKSNEVFTLVVTDEDKGRAMRMKVMPDLQLAPDGFDQPETKPIARKPFQNCFSKKARKLCYKSCKSAYRNVCRRMSCSSRSKRALKRQCKRSCKKTFEYSKYSDESGSTSDGSRSDRSSSDGSRSDDSSYSTDSDES